jgi:hypothetical protein
MGGPRFPGGGGGGRRSGGQRNISYKATVRWESAQPILDAQKSPLPETFANHYVISVSGIPLAGNGRRSQQTEDDEDTPRSGTQTQQDQLDRMKQSAILRPKDKELAQCGIVERRVSSGDVFLFGFSKDALALTPEDKEVEFQSRVGRALVKAKFNCKEMLYHGKLAV